MLKVENTTRKKNIALLQGKSIRYCSLSDIGTNFADSSESTIPYQTGTSASQCDDMADY
jgi:hypothetical protein